MYLKSWISSGLLYVKDLIDENGCIRNSNVLYDICTDKRNVHKDMFILNNYVTKKVKSIDYSIAPYVKICDLEFIVHRNKRVYIKGCKSKVLYNMFVQRVLSRCNMESIYAREFCFVNNSNMWENVYNQKVVHIKSPRLKEFNVKILHNFLPCGKVLSKWKGMSDKCAYCDHIETVKHMLYECQRLRDMWDFISDILKCNITWKQIVVGFPSCEDSDKIRCFNVIITIIAYAIFKENSHCKYENKNYAVSNITRVVKHNLREYMLLYDYGVCQNNERRMIQRIVEIM